MTGLPRVTVLALGGTIASSDAAGGGATVRLGGHDLLASLPQAPGIADVDVRSVLMVPSGDLRLADVFTLRSLAGQAIGAGACGVVVSQGTDTLEETSYALDLLTAFDQPVVFTGAMRTASAAGPDGPANLLAAIQVAASEQACGLGTLVVLSDQIHASRYVRKAHTSSTAAFTSPLAGPLGYLSEGRVRLLLRPGGRLCVHVPDGAPEVRVAQAAAFFDGDPALIGAVPSLGYQGLVLAGLGGGHVPSWTMPVLRQVAGQIPVVLTSRTGGGEGLMRTYGYPGSEADLAEAGLIHAAGTGVTQATVLLRLLLMAGADRAAIAGAFGQAMNPCGTVTIGAAGPS